MYNPKHSALNKPILSVYTGFFSGGARNVHTDIVDQMNDFGVDQVVVNIRDQTDRGLEGLQDKSEDSNYQRLISKNIRIQSLGLDATEDMFSEDSIRAMATELEIHEPRVVLCLKEQTVELVVRANQYLENYGLPTYPIIVALHRTDPGIQDPEVIERLRELEETPTTKKYILGYLACAESSALAYQRALGLDDESDRFTFVPNGIDLDLFKPATAAQKNMFFRKYTPDAFEDIKDAPLVVIGARNSKEKNIGLFLQSAVEFLSQNPLAHVAMCGTGMTEEKLAGAIRSATKDFPQDIRAHLEKRIHPIGPIPREDMAVLTSAANVVSLTSPTLGEADPLVLKEGMSCGAIPVSTCTGDTPRVLGVSQPQDHYLQEIDEKFILGKRGIITSQKAPDIAQAWAYAVEYPDQFSSNIEKFRLTIEKEKMVRRFQGAVENFCSRHESQALELAEMQYYGIYG